jgi:DNA-directed RNA polymerase II subunit RPB1
MLINFVNFSSLPEVKIPINAPAFAGLRFNMAVRNYNSDLMVNPGTPLEHSTQEVHKVKKIQFGVLSEQDVLKMSVCEVNSCNIYDKETRLPAEGGLNDPRMGVTTRGILCQSCFGDMKQCPGHFGHIKLTEPVYHIGFVNIVVKILKCVCYNCSRILLTDKKLKKISRIKNPRARLREILRNISSTCEAIEPGEDQNAKFQRGCGKKQPKYIKKKNDIYIKQSTHGEDDVDPKRLLRASQAYEILKRIDDEIVELLGMNSVFSRPENLIIKVLAVAPPCVRPSIELSSNAKSEDDITHMYQTILSTNMELEKAKSQGLPLSRLEEIVNRLQSIVGFMMNNEDNKAKQKGGRPIKSIRQRLKGKEGRLRGNLMGKRVDFSARTVVSPDPSLELDELGVPKTVAMTLTYPEVVTQLNIEFLRELVERGDEWPGARYYKRKVDGKTIDLNYVNTKPNLQYGDIVERHLMNGDYVLFNRQPSLHKMSIMGHRTRILAYSTFRLNLSVTTPYNADFDGDEMNMHVPQNLESKAEIMKIMHVPKQIVTPQSNRPVMGLVQDVLLGIKLFTLRDTFVNKEDLFNILMWIENWNGEIPKPAILKPKPLWTGKQIISMIIPKINYIKPNEADEKTFYEKDNAVIIKRGELLVGSFSKPIVGSTKGSLIGCIWIDYGPEETKNFITYAQRIINNWLLLHGFTVGIGDTIASNNILNIIEEKIKNTKKEFYEALMDTQKEKKKIIVHQPGKTIIESFEHKVNNLLNDCRADIGKLLNENIGKENNIKTMILAGSKGTNINISQISGLVGQQNVEGKRIPFGFLKRSLPHFLKDDFGPESKGFVANSYYKGLTPEEFFFHTMGGREGLIDTAVKTSQTGYMQRRLVKAMEDVMVQYDSTVRDSYGNIVQFLYGEDGIAGEYIEEQYFDLLKLPEDKLRKTCCFYELEGSKDVAFEDNVQKLYENDKIVPKVREELFKNKDAFSILEEEYHNILLLRKELQSFFTPNTNCSYLPVNISRLITHAQFNIPSKSGKSDLNPVDVVSEVKKLSEELSVVNGPDEVARKVNDNALKLFRAFLYFSLCSKKVVLEYKLSADAFRFLLNEVREKYQMSLVHPGEMVGSIAAQSIGETLTQMTLNTFHFAGVSSQNITLGVPRIQEIINCANNIKGPSMTIYLKEEFRYDLDSAYRLISLLEFTTLKHVAKVSEIYYDPDPSHTIIDEDQELIWFDQDSDKRKYFSPWVLRILIDPTALGRKSLQLKEIIRKIETCFADRPLDIVDSLESSDPIVLRLRQKNDRELNAEEATTQFHSLKKIEQFILEEMPIKGFCKKVSFKREPVKAFNAAKGVEIVGDKDGEYILETSGTDLAKVLSFPYVDTRRTTTNHVMDIYNVLGIEATREAILREIRIVFYYFEIYVNYRHTILLADVVTANGKPMSISRNGINRVYQSVLRKSSFEETVEIFLEASAFAEIDDLRGVTENVMLGQLCRLGTGSFDVMMDHQYFLPASSKEKEKVSAMWKYFPDLNPVHEMDGNIEEGEGQESKTPYAPNTPAPHTDYINKGTPAYGDFGQFCLSPQPFGNTPRGNRTPNKAHSPHGARTPISPYMNSNYDHVGGDQTQMMSPMLPLNSRALSPSITSNVQGTNNLGQSASDMRYSPISPHYQNNSPNRGYSPGGGAGRQYNSMSPSYSYNSPSSPNYTPNSSGTFDLTQALLRSHSRTAVLPCIHRTVRSLVTGTLTILRVRPTTRSSSEGKNPTCPTMKTKTKIINLVSLSNLTKREHFHLNNGNSRAQKCPWCNLKGLEGV